MKSIKIQTKNTNSPRSNSLNQNITSNTNHDKYMSIINSINFSKSSIREHLAKVMAQICKQIELKNQIQVSFYEIITKWLANKKNQQYQSNISNVLSDFQQFLKGNIQNFIKFSSQWNLNKNGYEAEPKIIRIKSEQRMKLRLVKQNEASYRDFQQTQVQKLEDKQKQIYQLKVQNKNLQRRILILSEQFSKIKKNYQTTIQKYKRIVNSSIINLQAQFDLKQLDGMKHNYKYMNINSLSSYQKSMKEQSMSGFKLTRDFRKIDRVNTQSSQKFVTIPTIPNFQTVSNKNLNRYSSYQNYKDLHVQ